MKKIPVFFCFAVTVLWSVVASAEFTIRVNFQEARLYLYDEKREIASFPVALPKATQKLPITGVVEEVEENPYWAPTKATREYYFKKSGVELPELIGPNDPRNAMGKGKIRITFNEARVDKTIRIHGTNQEKSIGQRVSRGCIRMRNDDIKKLSKIIRGKKTAVEFI